MPPSTLAEYAVTCGLLSRKVNDCIYIIMIDVNIPSFVSVASNYMIYYYGSYRFNDFRCYPLESALPSNKLYISMTHRNSYYCRLFS